MSDSKKIVVGVDGSPGSLKALRWALAEARRRNDAVEVIHSWHVPNYGDVTGMVPYPGDVLEQAAGEVMASVLAAVASDAAGVTLTSRIAQGLAAPTLIDASHDADMLVVGRRGHGGFLGLVMGSVAQSVAGHAHCPVTVVPTE